MKTLMVDWTDGPRILVLFPSNPDIAGGDAKKMTSRRDNDTEATVKSKLQDVALDIRR